jgi:hypothetical protein
MWICGRRIYFAGFQIGICYSSIQCRRNMLLLNSVQKEYATPQFSAEGICCCSIQCSRNMLLLNSVQKEYATPQFSAEGICYSSIQCRRNMLLPDSVQKEYEADFFETLIIFYTTERCHIRASRNVQKRKFVSRLESNCICVELQVSVKWFVCIVPQLMHLKYYSSLLWRSEQLYV